MRLRGVVLALGLVALALGGVALVAPGVVPFDPNRAFVTVVGVLALLFALGAIQARRHGDRERIETPDPEVATPTARPGDDFGAVLDEFVDLGPRSSASYQAREALGAIAAAVLTRFESYTEAEAREAVANGTWTDDDHAAAFLGSARSVDRSLRPLLRDAMREESAFERGQRRSIAAIVRTAGLDAASGDGAAGGGDDGAAGSGGGAVGGDGAGGVLPHAPWSEADGDRETATSSVRRTTTSAASSDGGTAAVGGVDARSTGHWRGVSAVALIGIGVGILSRQPAVLLAGVVGIGFVAYARPSAPPSTDVSIERTVETDRPDPGDEVDVTVTVTNVGERSLPDIRLVDGVPEGLSVVEGSPRLGTALRPGEGETIEYSVRARRGVHDFEPALAIGRDLATTTERDRRVGPETTLTCVPPLGTLAEPLALRNRGSRLVGREDATSAGEGIEFHSTREYRPGDPMGRIDWNRRARTGHLSTVEFREERAATVLLLIDAREAAYRSPSPEPPNAVDRSVDAAGKLFEGLLANGNRVGIAAAPTESCWLAPGTDAEHAVAARELLATHPALSPVPRERASLSSRWRRTLRRRLSRGTQIVFLTPLCDDGASEIARQFDERGYPVTVVGVDPTVDRSPGNRLARVTRSLRVSALRSANVPVVDWAWDESLAAAVARANERGSL